MHGDMKIFMLRLELDTRKVCLAGEGIGSEPECCEKHGSLKHGGGHGRMGLRYRPSVLNEGLELVIVYLKES